MSEINRTLTVEALEESIEEEIDGEGAAFITEPELEDVMRGYDVGVETGEQLIDRLSGERGWAYEVREDGFEVSDERWKLSGGDDATPEDMW